MIVYLAIFAFMSLVVINSFMVILRSFNHARINRDLLESGATAMERISRELRKSKVVNVANSSFGSNPGILQLDNLNVTGTPDSIIRFTVTNGDLNITENGTVIGNLLGENVSVTNLIFRRITTPHGDAVKIELTIQIVSGGIIRSENFYDTILSRGTIN